LAAARHEVEPVSTATFGRFLPAWQHLGTGELRGIDGVAAVVEQLAGVPIPASALESLVLPARVRDYSPAMLDELMATGEVRWSGHGAINAKDGWIALHLADQAPVTLPPADDIELTETHLRLLTALGAQLPAWSPGSPTPSTTLVDLDAPDISPDPTAVQQGSPPDDISDGSGTVEVGAPASGRAAATADNADGPGAPAPTNGAISEGAGSPRPAEQSALMRVPPQLHGGGAYFFRQLSDATGLLDDAAVADALWELVWAGLVSGDTFAPVRARLAGSTRTPTAHRSPRRTPRGRAYLPRQAMPTRSGPPTVAGRWSLLPDRLTDNTIRAHATADLLLERYGVLTRGSVQSEGVAGGFALMYRVLTEFEDRGRCRRGYFIDSLGGAQFSTTDVVDRLRSFDGDRGRGSANGPDGAALALAACDPANPYGAALPWPKGDGESGHRPGRKAGALVVLVGGELVLYLERGGKTLLTFTEDPTARQRATRALAALVHERRVDSLVIDRVDGESVHGNTFAAFLTDAGFAATPRGLRLRGRP
ncbi:ATP-dependent helicase, partial [Nocardia cyriacigeorgica]|nr:ATP-dependent helicase [Nocardia cyriacigeorgica]